MKEKSPHFHKNLLGALFFRWKLYLLFSLIPEFISSKCNHN
jgi:hypothetical protein